jgi:mono/diheme cytochrome c family protein
VTKFRACVLAVILALMGGAGPVAAQDLPGDPARGREIAQEWCIECHEVAREPSVTGAPPFQAVADDPAVTETALRAFLQTPHTRMPDIQPTPQQTDDLIAFILSLQGHRSGI